MTQTTTPQPSIKDRVQSVIDWMRPIIQADGGDVELVDVSAEGTVHPLRVSVAPVLSPVHVTGTKEFEVVLSPTSTVTGVADDTVDGMSWDSYGEGVKTRGKAADPKVVLPELVVVPATK